MDEALTNQERPATAEVRSPPSLMILALSSSHTHLYPLPLLPSPGGTRAGEQAEEKGQQAVHGPQHHRGRPAVYGGY